MILLIDNYDSFSYNLYQLIGGIEPDITVVRNDAYSVDEIAAMAPAGIVLSPGPHRPEDAGVCIQVARELTGTVPLLGVCLGHQAICAAFGATVGYAKELMHGKQSIVTLDTACPLFAGCPAEVPAARYHSLAVDEATLKQFELKNPPAPLTDKLKGGEFYVDQAVIAGCSGGTWQNLMRTAEILKGHSTLICR